MDFIVKRSFVKIRDLGRRKSSGNTATLKDRELLSATISTSAAVGVPVIGPSNTK
jgi:hypothetical protein